MVVSNHGGRATETLRATLEALPEVVAAVDGRIPIFVDGGFRRGTDVFKGLALGAKAVGIGRPFLWGLGAFGQVGVDRVIEIMQGELKLCMGNCGTATVAENVRRGIGFVPQGHNVFPNLTVAQNLRIAGLLFDPSFVTQIYQLFPVLAERRQQRAGSMSGGEQQMLALGRALMLAPRILLIDEPSVGLAPVLVSRTIDAIRDLKQQYKLTVLMAEQNFPQALRIADRGYVIVHGKIAFAGDSVDELNNNDLIKKFYLGL